MRTRRLAVSAGALAIAVLAVLALTRWASPGAAPAAAPGGGPSATRFEARSAGARAPALPADTAELVAYLRARFGKHIANSYVQLQMIEKLMRHFQEQNPAGWRDDLLAAVRAAFPERYAELAANLQHRLDYEAWLDANRDRLAGLGERERRDAVWAERQRLFGEAAAGEIWASARRNEAVSEALVAIDADASATVGERLARYQEALEGASPEDPTRHAQNHGQDLDRFLGLESVQRELAALPPDDRAAALRDVRKGLGLDAPALDRWDTLDRERDRRWDVGRSYMAARAALAAEHTGEALEAQLRELRDRLFGAEAATIAEEEANGFFRFDRPRRYGLN